MSEAERVETLIIGGGQSGLSVGYHLAKRGLPFVIVDANARIGDSWRNRWDSLRLFTPARYNGLPGMPFPAPPHTFPTKDQMADFLEAYAARFDLQVRNGVRVDRLFRDRDRLVATAGDMRIEADNVVVAMATHQVPWVPHFASELDPGIVQMHTHNYRNPSHLQKGGVLVVGAGNSGAEISLDVVGGHRTWLSGRSTGHIPFRIGTPLARHLLLPFVLGFLGRYVITVNTPIGRRVRPRLLTRGGPLVRVKPSDITAAGIERVPRVAGVRDGRPVLEDQRVLGVENVIWCTGFGPDYSWIDLPIFGDSEHAVEPEHERGIVPREPGSYFVGLFFLYSLASGVLGGVGTDALHVVEHIASRTG